jgi:hypothetical protein
MRKHVALCREVHGERHPHTLVAIHNLVELLRRQGGAEVEALLLLREYSDASASVLGERHPDSIDAAVPCVRSSRREMSAPAKKDPGRLDTTTIPFGSAPFSSRSRAVARSVSTCGVITFWR